MPGGLLLGAIADDYTGATDLAGMLSSRGVRTVQVLGRQPDALVAGLGAHYQAVVVALKSRSVPAAEARELSLQVLRQLQGLGARQIYFKYCSTFDSSAAGNIGPVTDALMEALGARFTVAVPSLPVNGRTQYLGHLFVGGQLLSDSPMRDHPVTPMTDANLVRHLQAQTRRRVGLIPYSMVAKGADAIREEAARLQGQGIEIALVDVLSDGDLTQIALATADVPLVTAGSGLGLALAEVWAARGLLTAGARPGARVPIPTTSALVLAGSCSQRTLEQIFAWQAEGWPSVEMDLGALLFSDGGAAAAVDRLVADIARRLAAAPALLVFSSRPPAERVRLLADAQARGVSGAAVSHAIESAMARIARAAVGAGTRRLVVAGGETSGAVVEALGIPALEIGEMLDPGVPHCRAVDGSGLELFLKSGNFGGPDFLLKAVRHFRSLQWGVA